MEKDPSGLPANDRPLRAALFLALLSTAITLGGALAHAFELPNKIGVSREAYFIMQRAYDGWWMLAFVLLAQFLSIAAVIYLARRRHAVFWYAVTAFLGVAGAQAVFWIYTQPANAATSNWTVQPENWEALRRMWEYSHLSGAIFQLTAMVMLLLAALSRR
jgi:hypothetical protein